MEVPHDVDRKSVESHALNRKQSVLPILDRNSRVMNLSSNQFQWRHRVALHDLDVKSSH